MYNLVAKLHHDAITEYFQIYSFWPVKFDLNIIAINMMHQMKGLIMAFQSVFSNIRFD